MQLLDDSIMKDGFNLHYVKSRMLGVLGLDP